MMALPMAVMAAGSLVSGFAQSAQANREAAVEDQNAKIAEQQAASDADAVRRKAVILHGQQMASAGASGIAPSGFIDAISDSDIEAELDAQTATYNGKIRAANFRNQAAASRTSGNSELMGGIFGAGSKALSAYGAWKQPDPNGVG